MSEPLKDYETAQANNAIHEAMEFSERMIDKIPDDISPAGVILGLILMAVRLARVAKVTRMDFIKNCKTIWDATGKKTVN